MQQHIDGLMQQQVEEIVARDKAKDQRDDLTAPSLGRDVMGRVCLAA